MSDYTKGLEEQLEQMRMKLAAVEVERDELLVLKPYWGVPYSEKTENYNDRQFIRWKCDFGTRQFRIGYVFCDSDNLKDCTHWHVDMDVVDIRLKGDHSGYSGHIKMQDAQAVVVGTFKASIKDYANE
jgi:hypothetical protein